MVFCCIAIAAVAVVYFVGLWIRQIFSFPRPDLTASELPAPPRALSGNGALPVYGHTRHFVRLAGDVALLFSPDWREVPFLPARWSRCLGHCFAIFIWGQWRVVVKGSDRARKVFESGELLEGWPWTPPETLLGKSCFSFLSENERQQLRIILGRPLSHRSVTEYAAVFAELAEKCLNEIKVDAFKKDGNCKRSTTRTRFSVEVEYGTDVDDDIFFTGPSGEAPLKLKWEALRSYTLDIVDGPILGMYRWVSPSQARHQPTVANEQSSESSSDKPPRNMMLLWMDRMKKGIDVIKCTFGPEWMRIWLMNEYGRALNARMHLEEELKCHVADVADSVPVTHLNGHAYHDPTTQPIPLLTMRTNAQRGKEDIFGELIRSQETEVVANRQRTRSLPNFESSYFVQSDPEVADKSVQDVATNKFIGNEAASTKNSADKTCAETGTVFVKRRITEQVLEGPTVASRRASQENQPRTSVLENILRQQDLDGKGITKTVTTEICILLWLMMEMGNAWTYMALHLLSTDREACRLVQEEIDSLEIEFGHSKLFTGGILSKMRYLDALLYEAIRLLPANLGGLKVTTKTVEFEDIGVQIPKGSNVIFCQPTDDSFDIHAALGKRPEMLGRSYPSVELHGFLPLQGLEVPCMVLQTKVFLICLLQKYSPLMCKRKTIIRRLSESVKKRISHNVNKDGLMCSETHSDLEIKSQSTDSADIANSKAMHLFTKLPFPEPKRVTKLSPRVLT